MATLIKHKRVEFSELFYDLVFVFAISKATALIHTRVPPLPIPNREVKPCHADGTA